VATAQLLCLSTQIVLHFIRSILFALSLACASLQAGLIVHYDFSDGDLLDNEVSASDYRLESMRSTERSMSRVGLNTLDGTAVFGGGTQLNCYGCGRCLCGILVLV
jgi:hypothetical protein